MYDVEGFEGMTAGKHYSCFLFLALNLIYKASVNNFKQIFIWNMHFFPAFAIRIRQRSRLT